MAQAALNSRLQVEVALIRTDGGTQPRAEINHAVVDEYASAIADGAQFPPVVVFYDGSEYWLADGFHRHAAHEDSGLVDIDVDIRQGTRRDAVLFSVGANASHGLRRTNEDKRRAVLTLLRDDEWSRKPQTWIAETAGVNQSTVSRIAAEISDDASYALHKMREVTRNGTTYFQDTSNIGRSLPPASIVGARLMSEVDAEAGISREAPANDNEPATRLSSFSGDNEWYTPARYVDLAREVMGGIDLDPASNDYAQRTVRADHFYTVETNGLDKEWSGRVWMNPPYSQPEVNQFADKIISEFASGRVSTAVVLTNNSGDTAWHQSMANACSAICITRGRIRFESPTRESTSPAMGQSFFYFGQDVDAFRKAFSEIGKIWVNRLD